MNERLFYYLNIKYKNSKNSFWAFASAIFFGILVHITAWTNYLINHDSSYGLKTDLYSTHALAEGKWFANFWILLRGPVMSSGISVPQAIFLIALTAGLIVKILDIKQQIWSVIVGGMLVLMPSVFCAFSYQGYSFFFALFFSVLAVYYTDKYKFGIFISIILTLLSVATYQAYIGFSLSLYLQIILLKLLEGKISSKRILLKGVKYISVLVISIIMYYIILLMITRFLGVALSSYRGIEKLGKIDFTKLPLVVFNAYKKVLIFFWYDAYGTQGVMVLFFRGLLMIGLILLIRIFIRNKIYKNYSLFFINLFLILLFPLSIHVIAILSQNSDTHWIMIYPFVLIFIFIIKLADFYLEKHYWKKDIFIEIILCLLCFGTLWDWSNTANQAYQRLRIAYENTYATGIMLVHDIYSLDGYSSNMPVVFVKSPSAQTIFKEEKEYFSYLNNFTGIVDSERIMYKQYNISIFLQDFIGANIQSASEELEEAIKSREEVYNMPNYPETNSIAIIDNVIVVKLSDY